MQRGRGRFGFWVCALGALALLRGALAADIISLATPVGTTRGHVVRITNMEVVLRNSSGKECQVPLVLLKPRDLYLCRRQLLAPDDARSRFELGEFCLKHDMRPEAEQELQAAARLDAAGYKEKVEALLQPPAPAPPDATPATPLPLTPAPQKEEPAAKAEKLAPTPRKSQQADAADEDGELVEVTGPDGKRYKIPAKFLPSKKDIKPLAPDAMKKFLADRLEQLKEVCGGEWTMDETGHFYIFSNLSAEQKGFFKQACEEVYKLLCDVLQHKDGDPLWNNKCPMYFIAKRSQFVKFAAGIERKPGAAASGGYFNHEGRQVHIVIPLYDMMNPKEAMRRATNTLRHETTHAFLQLSGNDVEISRWMHEGMAQFIEFWYDPQNNPDRHRIVGMLREYVRTGNTLGWREGQRRPLGGMDTVGYAFAWARLSFLYHAFLPDKTKLPRMIKLIKDGKTEEQAMEQVYGKPIEELERFYDVWLKEAAKTSFKF